MPVPSNISDLSKVAGDNSPQGTESAKGTIDDYFRAHASFIRQLADLAGGPTVALASGSIVNVGFAGSANILITGTANVFGFDNIAEGTLRWVGFAGALTMTHSATSFVLPGAANISTMAGDVALFKSLGGGNWKCLVYQRISGTSAHPASATRDGYLSAADWSAFNSKQPALGFAPYPASNPANYLSATAAAATYLPLTGGTMIGEHILKLGGALGTQRVGMTVTQGSNVVRYRWGLDSDESPVLFTYNTSGVYNGTIQFPAGGINATGAIVGTTVTETSDGRLKKLWRRLAPDLLQNVAAMKKVGTFAWRKDGTTSMGGSAQEIEKFMPSAVVTDAAGFKSVRYGAAAFVIVVELTRAFLAHVAETEKRLSKLEAR